MEKFIDPDNVVAVIGVSQTPSKYGSKMYLTLKDFGYKVYGINPKYAQLWGDKIYPNIAAVTDNVDVAIIVVPPQVTEKVVIELQKAGIKKVWMQPGSESEQAIKFCEVNGINCIHHACFVVDGLKKEFTS